MSAVMFTYFISPLATAEVWDHQGYPPEAHPSGRKCHRLLCHWEGGTDGLLLPSPIQATSTKVPKTRWLQEFCLPGL